jgi:DNA-binding NarL/FixJ family response regulator
MRVLIADDSLLIRDGLASLLRENGIEVVAQTDSVDGLLAKIAGHRPDVAIIDIRMHQRTPTKGCAPRLKSGPATPRSGS